MAYNKTVSTLRAEIQERGEIPTNYVSNSELTAWMNGSLAELYDLVVDQNKDFYVSTNTIAITSGNTEYSLPTDFYRLVGVDIEDSSGQNYAMRKYQFHERNLGQGGSGDKLDARYRIINSQFHVSPSPTWSGSVYVHYIPAPPSYATNGDDDSCTFDFVAGWDEYVVLDCLIKFAGKDEQDPSIFMAQKETTRRRVVSMSQTVDDNEPDKVRDVENEYLQDRWPNYWNP